MVSCRFQILSKIISLSQLWLNFLYLAIYLTMTFFVGFFCCCCSKFFKFHVHKSGSINLPFIIVLKNNFFFFS